MLKIKNIFNINFNKNEIIKTIKKIEKSKIKKNIFFGKGNADNIIIKILSSQKFWETNFQKNFVDINKLILN